MRRRSVPLPGMMLLLVAVMTGTGCSKDSTSPDSGSTCDQRLAAAQTALENALYAEIDSDPQRPSDIDFQHAYQLYQQALQCSPTSADANFGASVLGLLALTSDAQVNAAFDEWQAYLSAHTPFEAPSARARPLGVPLGFTSGPTALRLPFDLATVSVLALAQPRRIAADPQLADAQAILETKVLPRLTEALVRLDVVAANPSYRFIVTPKMQGDLGASPVEIDHTDILALRAACGLLASACHVAVSYNINFAAYDSLSMYQALTLGSGWMALRSQGASHMANAGITLSGAVDDLDDAITSLLAENDPQDDDVIKIGPDGVSRAEAESVQVHLDDVRLGLTTGYTRTDDWDQNPGTPDKPLMIRLGQLFTNPVPDWKALFPTYTVAVQKKASRYTENFGYGQPSVDVTAPAAGYYSGYYSLSAHNHQIDYEYSSGDAFIIAPIQQAIQNQYTAAQATPNWTGDFSGAGSFGGPLNAGVNTITFFYNTYTQVAAEFIYWPVITWTADTFAQWTWPDPTLHGVLPGMGSTDELLSTFGITEQQWNKVVELSTASNGPPLARRRPLP